MFYSVGLQDLTDRCSINQRDNQVETNEGLNKDVSLSITVCAEQLANR